MTQPNRNRWQTSLTLRQLIGIVIVLAVAVAFIVTLHYIERRLLSHVTYSEVEMAGDRLDSLNASVRSRYAKYEYPHRKKVVLPPISMTTFDPNTADSLLLLQLGLKPWQAKTLIAYRTAGAVFRKAEDMRKLYFMSDTLYSRLEPYITIQADSLISQTSDSLHTTFVHRVKKDTILELNSADTAQLQLLRGVGRYTALQIVRYRQQLGGYVSVNQLYEIEKINTDSFASKLTVDTALVVRLRVNYASVDRLQRHPYLTFTKAKALYTFRREHVRLTKQQFVSEQDIFSAAELEKILPYLDFSVD